jgi:hypothetical protein
MRWEDERYIRIYTRDTADWLALGWEAQSLLVALLRKVDRAGILMLGKTGARGVAGVTGFPLEVVERALPILLGDGCVRQAEGVLVVPNFRAAQESARSDKARKREQRARDRARTLVDTPSPAEVTTRGQGSHDVTAETTAPPREDTEALFTPGGTKRDRESQNVTESHAELVVVTNCDGESQRATERDTPSRQGTARHPEPLHAMRRRAVPSVSNEAGARAREAGLPTGEQGQAAGEPSVQLSLVDAGGPAPRLAPRPPAKTKTKSKPKAVDLDFDDLTDDETWVFKEIVECEALARITPAPHALARELLALASGHGLDAAAIVRDARVFLGRARKKYRDGAAFLRAQVGMRAERSAAGEARFRQLAAVPTTDAVGRNDGGDVRWPVLEPCPPPPPTAVGGKP